MIRHAERCESISVDGRRSSAVPSPCRGAKLYPASPAPANGPHAIFQPEHHRSRLAAAEGSGQLPAAPARAGCDPSSERVIGAAAVIPASVSRPSLTRHSLRLFTSRRPLLAASAMSAGPVGGRSPLYPPARRCYVPRAPDCCIHRHRDGMIARPCLHRPALSGIAALPWVYESTTGDYGSVGNGNWL